MDTRKQNEVKHQTEQMIINNKNELITAVTIDGKEINTVSSNKYLGKEEDHLNSH